MFDLKRFTTLFLKIFLILIIVAMVSGALLIGYLSIARNAELTLPLPSGRSPVGRILYSWVDSKRNDLLADQPNIKRQLEVWVWYPAQVNSESIPAPYLPAAWIKSLEKNQGLSFLLENNFNRIQTHSYENVPVSEIQSFYPVVIMSPALGQMAIDYTVFAENLASNGYIVVGINPTHSSKLIMFPDGSTAAQSSKGAIPGNTDPVTAENNANLIGSVWANDVYFVMDQLKIINAANTDPLYNKLSLAHLGILGLSFGGAVAMEICQQDARCDAGVDLDGTPYGRESQAAIPQPFMFLMQDYTVECDSNCEAIRQASQLVDNNYASFLLSIRGTKHFNFSDLPLRQLPSVRPFFTRAGYTGSIDPQRAMEITNAYLLAFFNKYLKNIDSDLLKKPSQAFPEVQFG